MTTIHVVDTGVLISDWERRHPSVHLVTTQAVIDEVLNSLSQRRVENLISVGRLSIRNVDESVFEEVIHAAQQSGDISVLSKTDQSLLALAQSMRRAGYNVTLVSTDTAVLNTASFLGISVLDPTSKMRHRVTWSYRCPACGYIERQSPSSLECPVCGTMMHRRAISRRRIR